MDALKMYAILALLADAVVDTLMLLVGVFSKNPKNWSDDDKHRLAATVVCILMAYATGADLFALAGVTLKWEPLAIGLSGLLFSRGGQWVGNLLTSVKGFADQRSATAAMVQAQAEMHRVNVEMMKAQMENPTMNSPVLYVNGSNTATTATGSVTLTEVVRGKIDESELEASGMHRNEKGDDT